MNQGAPWSKLVDGDKTAIAAINGLHPPQWIECWNNDAAAWVPGSWYMVDFTAGALTAFGNPGAAIIGAVNNVLTIGVAMDATPTQSHGRIQVYGKYVGANVVNGTAAGALLTPSSATAGRAMALPVQANGTAFPIIIGLCLVTAGGTNATDVFIGTMFRG